MSDERPDAGTRTGFAMAALAFGVVVAVPLMVRLGWLHGAVVGSLSVALALVLSQWGWWRL